MGVQYTVLLYLLNEELSLTKIWKCLLDKRVTRHNLENFERIFLAGKFQLLLCDNSTSHMAVV